MVGHLLYWIQMPGGGDDLCDDTGKQPRCAHLDALRGSQQLGAILFLVLVHLPLQLPDDSERRLRSKHANACTCRGHS